MSLQQKEANQPKYLQTASMRKWVLLFACVVMLVTTIPYILGYAVQGTYYRFTGFVFGVQDGNSYIAKMLSGTFDAWLFRSPYTIASQRGVLMYLPYILLGKLAAPVGLHVQLVILFHLFRFAAGVLMILASFDFLSFFVKDARLRCFGVILIALGGGLGWLMILFGQGQFLGSLPLEFYSPESFGFLSLFGLPHLAFARACMLWTLLIYLKVIAASPISETPDRTALKAGLLWLLAGLFQPLTLVVIGIVMVFHLASLAVWQIYLQIRGKSTSWVRWRRLLRFVILTGILPGLLLAYYTFSTLKDPFLSDWSFQNVLTSPHPMHYLLAYGMLIPFTWLGGRQILRKNSWTGLLLVGWVLLLPFLAYFPVSIQRRLPDGIWIALCVLALLSLQDWSEQALMKKPSWRFVNFIALLLFFPSTLMLWWGGVQAGGNVRVPLFRSLDEVTLFEYLQAEVEPGETVLSSYETGNPLPAWAPVNVVIGHGPESAHLQELIPLVQRFYDASTTEAQRLDWIAEREIDYIFWGPLERNLGAWNPQLSDYLHLVKESGDYQLFEVLP